MSAPTSTATELFPRPTSGWQEMALCAQIDPELWYPDAGLAVEARRICASCPVAAQCLQDALADTGDEYGIRAGTSPRRRETIRSQARREAAQVEQAGRRAAA